MGTGLPSDVSLRATPLPLTLRPFGSGTDRRVAEVHEFKLIVDLM